MSSSSSLTIMGLVLGGASSSILFTRMIVHHRQVRQLRAILEGRISTIGQKFAVSAPDSLRNMTTSTVYSEDQE
ncbi:MAG TPA: hypothetical protein VE955_11095 [Candidatus Dormibacteraeota bacterium]|jgi:hypothetical protein|nr:hypothetical protein [Candidatus Dormibacteraeota bacterium]